MKILSNDTSKELSLPMSSGNIPESDPYYADGCSGSSWDEAYEMSEQECAFS